MKKQIALVLGSGGAKGFAHIGAIEELERQGYEITSIAGTSMGALIGGLYAAGGLSKVKEWMYALTRKKVFSLVDFTLRGDSIVKGDRVMEALQDLVPDQDIRDLRIPFCAVATDMKAGDEVHFREGSLYDAIRASISIPMLFTPVETGEQLLVDGGLTNGLPLDCVVRHEGDLLVAVDLDDYHWESDEDEDEDEEDRHKHFPSLPFSLSLPSFRYFSLVRNTIYVLQKRNTELALRLTPPDIYMHADVSPYGSYDYDKAKYIAQIGRKQMKKVLDNYNKHGKEQQTEIQTGK